MLPLLLVQVPPIVDYPNHLARMWILVNHSVIPEIAHNYAIHWRILPDMGMDLIVPVLAKFMSVVTAGRVFVGLAMLTPVVGTVVLYRVLHGRFAIWPIWSVLFVYNTVLFFGFVDCLFSCGLYMLVFSGWIASRNWRPLPRILLFSVLAALLFSIHLFAFGLYGLTVASYELGRRLEGRRLPLRNFWLWARDCLQFVPGLVLWYLSLGNVSSAMTSYGNLSIKYLALFVPVHFGFAVTPLAAVMWLSLTTFIVFVLTRRAVRFIPEMKLPLVVLIVTAILMPSWVNGSALVDWRLPAILPSILLAVTDLEIAREGVKRALAAVALLLLAVRVWTVNQCWQDYEHWFNEFRQASKVIKPGSRLLIVESNIPQDQRFLPGVPNALAFIEPVLFSHMGALAVIDRSVFFPYLFTQATPLSASTRNAGIAQSASEPVLPLMFFLSASPKTGHTLAIGPDDYGQLPYWRNWPQDFDYVLWIDFGTSGAFNVPHIRIAADGSFFKIYKITRPGEGL